VGLILLEKLTGSPPVKKFSAFYGTRRYLTAFTWVTSFPRPDPDYVNALPLFYIISILIVSFFVCVGLTNASFLLQVLSPNPCTYLLHSPPHVPLRPYSKYK
jgi:hypothetical protein